jgi:hypothetical protein
MHVIASPPPSAAVLSIPLSISPLSIIVPEELPMPDELLELPLDEPPPVSVPASSGGLFVDVVLHPGCAVTIANPAMLTASADKATLFMCLSQSS